MSAERENARGEKHNKERRARSRASRSLNAQAPVVQAKSICNMIHQVLCVSLQCRLTRAGFRASNLDLGDGAAICEPALPARRTGPPPRYSRETPNEWACSQASSE